MEQVTWKLTRNSVNNRMIESSLIHSFSGSKKFRKRTKLFNNWLEKNRNLHSYKDYVDMKLLMNENVSKDLLIEDDDSYGEEDYSIKHKNIYKSRMQASKNEMYNNKGIISSTPKKIKTQENEISFTDSYSHKVNKKNTKTRSNILQDNLQNTDIPFKKKQLMGLRCLKEIEKAQLTDDEKSSNFLNTSDDNTVIKSKEKLTEVFLDNDVNQKSVDYSEISKIVNHIQEDISNNANNISQTTEDISYDVNITPEKQKIAMYNSNKSCDNINLSNIESNEVKNDICLLDSPAERKQKTLPKITSTEIIHIKYKTINKEESYNNLQNESYDSDKLLEKNYFLKPLEYEQEEEEEESQDSLIHVNSMNSSILSSSEKRLKQLKNLNLTVESSSSEDEMLQQPNLNKKILFNNSNCTVFKKIVTCNKNSNPTVENNSSEAEMLQQQNSNEKICIDNLNCISKKTTWSKLKLKKSSNIDHKSDQGIFNIWNKNNSINHKNNSTDHHSEDNNEYTTESKETDISKNYERLQTLHERPCNLQDFIREEKLIQDLTTSAFTLKDLSKDEEIFLLDIPKTVQLESLEGQRIILKQKRLKLGKNKYEILYKDVPSQSCVFNTCKNNKPYKIVNVKPTGSIVVRRKLHNLK